MSGSGSGETTETEKSDFPIDAYIFNGHGEDLMTADKYTLPANVYYITVVECGEISYLNAVLALQKFRQRNPVFSEKPSKEESYKYKLANALGLFDEVKEGDTEEEKKIVSKIHVHKPGSSIVDNTFIPISESKIQSGKKKVAILDGASGLISRDTWRLAKRDIRRELEKRVFVDEKQKVTEEEAKQYQIEDKTIEDISKLFEFSIWPKQIDINELVKKEKGDKKKAIAKLLTQGEKVSVLIDRVVAERDKTDTRPIVFFNPLCRFVPSQSKKTKEEVELQKASSQQQAEESDTESETETVPSLTPSSSGETTSSSGSESTTEEESETESEPEEKKTTTTRTTRSQTQKTTPGGRRRTYRRQVVPKRKTYRNKKLKRQTRKRR